MGEPPLKHSASYALPIPDTAAARRKPVTTRFLRILKVLITVSVAATLSTLVPSPWSLLRNERSSLSATRPNVAADPADEWRDDVWPIRAQTPWDISTDFPYPRTLEFDVQEGTWLRLDVHPKSGDIVFDMAGDLYCLPASAYAQANIDSVSTAHPVLLGIPHDSDPHFSPEGDRLVFRSDAELGVENIWVIKWSGCEDASLLTSPNEQLFDALKTKEVDNKLLVQGVKETAARKRRRLIREGRLGAHRVTNETYRFISDARFHPSGSKVIATKWYTSDRSLGAGEGWEYSVPNASELGRDDLHDKKISVGSGTRLVGRTLPSGWSATQYGDQQVGPEQFIWRGNDSVIYSKNVRDSSKFTYSKDIHQGIYAIFSRNLTSGRTETLVNAFPGGASRPELSRDGGTLAFVQRVRDKEALVLKDLRTGTIRHVWYGLTYDLTTVSAPMGTYPSFAFTPSDDAIIIWAAGQIYSVPLSVNAQGEKVAAKTSPAPIRFTAHIEKRLAETLRGGLDLVGLEIQETQRVRSFKELRADDTGRRVVFQAAGVSYVQKVGHNSIDKVPVACSKSPYYSPAFVHGADDLILHARWSDVNFTSFEVANLTSGTAYELVNVPLGRYHSPVFCECDSRHRKIAFIKTDGDLLTGNTVATAGAGLYIGEADLPSSNSKGRQIPVYGIRFIPSEINPDDTVELRFLEGSQKLLVQQSSRSFIIDIGAGPNELGDYAHHTLATGEMSTELVASPRESQKGYTAENVVFVDFFNVYLAPGSKVVKGEGVWSKPANATEGLVRLSLDGGHDVTWSRDGKKVFWFLGSYLHSLEVSKIAKCSSSIKHDTLTFGISCVKGLLEFQEIVVEHSTDIARLKKDAKLVLSSDQDLDSADVLVIYNATLLTMESGSLSTDLVRNGVLVSKGGVISSVNDLENTFVPTRATVINAHGGFVVPGFIDVHAHWGGFSSPYPSTSWELETFLAYGVTTLHNPSADNVEGFDERSRVESGQLVGPRIFTVGDVIYGAGAPDIHQDIADSAEAYSALVRIKAEGGPASISYKNYNIPSRASRQRLLLAARNLTMLCVPEGGMNQDWDITYFLDGMSTVEHALPVPVLYDDILTLYALSGTGATPTHIVNYGGVWGEQLVWATEDIPNDPKLRRFTRHDTLQGLTESTARPANSYALFNTSSSVAKMVHKGLLAHIGAHGEPPLGLNYHAEMFFTEQGGLSNYEVLQAATSSAAITLGLQSSIGSLAPGKLADFIVYPPDVDLLGDSILRSRELKYVARGGRIWDASTMEEVWPVKGKKQVLPPFNAD